MDQVWIAEFHEPETLAAWVQKYYEYEGLVFDEKVRRACHCYSGETALFRSFKIVVDTKMAVYCVLSYGFDFEVGGRYGVITDLFLEEPYRGQGLGPRLLTHVLEIAKKDGVSHVELWVLNHNSRARGMYESMGFHAVQDRDHLFLSLH